MPPCHGGGRGFESRPVRRNRPQTRASRGFLVFTLFGKQPLENYLPEIVSKLEIASAELTAEQEKHRKYFEEIERKRQAMIVAQQLKENELSEFKDLPVKAERWQKVNNLRNYLAAVEKTIGQNEAPERIKSWLGWSHMKADGMTL